MPRTFFQDFTRDNGDPITVEYGVDGHYSPTTYSPSIGAVGGDAPEIYIVSAWPNTDAYNELCRRKREIEDRGLGKGIQYFLGDKEPDEELHEIEAAIAAADEACQLTDAERERIETWLDENHVDDYDDEPSF